MDYAQMVGMVAALNRRRKGNTDPKAVNDNEWDELLDNIEKLGLPDVRV